MQSDKNEHPRRWRITIYSEKGRVAVDTEAACAWQAMLAAARAGAVPDEPFKLEVEDGSETHAS